MKKQQHLIKLAVHKEAVRVLGTHKLGAVAGAAPTTTVILSKGIC